jgi:YebC/PmpR family DNA-binding regulatory protein
MAGHNKWSKVKNVKGPADAKRGKLFTKLIKELTVAARVGGGEPDGNPRLRQAITAAKAASMPKDNIDKAIKRGTGELQDGTAIEEAVYEGYGPGGVAVIVESASDNKNRTVSDLRLIFKSHGGNFAESGSVAWMFTRHGSLVFEKEKYPEDKVMDVALESGAQDVSTHGEVVEVLTEPNEVYAAREVFERVGMHAQSAGFAYVAKTTVPVEAKDSAEKLMEMLHELEEHDDVQRVHANFDHGSVDKLFAEGPTK